MVGLPREGPTPGREATRAVAEDSCPAGESRPREAAPGPSRWSFTSGPTARSGSAHEKINESMLSARYVGLQLAAWHSERLDEPKRRVLFPAFPFSCEP
jgi:hypothetical protein